MTTPIPLYNRLVAWNDHYKTDSNHRLEYAKAISALWTILTQVENRREFSSVARMWAVTVTGLSERENR